MLPEIEQYLVMIEDLLDQVTNLVKGLSVEALNWRPIEGVNEHATNSLAVLAAHIAGADKLFGIQVAGGKPVERDRDAEFVTIATSADELVTLLRDTKQQIRKALIPLTNEDLDRDVELGEHKFSARWAILHVIDHTALHLGHMQLTYQLGRNGQAGASPRWFERVDG